LAIPSSGAWRSRLSVDGERQGFKDDRTSFSRGHALWRTTRSANDRRLWFLADVNVLRQDPASPHPRQGTTLSARVPLDANHNPDGAFLNENRINVGVGYERPLGASRLGTIASFTHTAHDNFRGFLADVSEGPGNAVGFRQAIDITDLYADVHLTLPQREHTRVVVGVDWLHGMGDSKGAVFDYTVPLSGATATSVAEPTDLELGEEDRRDFVGGYALAEWRPTARVTLSAGLRLNLTNEEREEGNETEAQRAAEEGNAQTNTRLSGSVGAIVSLWEQGTNHVRAFANYRNTFKPAVFDFGLGEAEEGGLLEPETSQSVEGGLKARFFEGRMDVEASAFRMDFTNLVTATVVNGLPALLNAGETRFQGFEVATDARMPHHLTGRASYSYHDGKFVDFEQAFDGVLTRLDGRRFEMSPRHLFSAGAYLSPEEGLIASAVVRYTGDRFMDKRNRALAAGFRTVDAGVGYRFDRYELRLDGRNLNDARDVVSESEVGDAQYYRMTARDIRVSLGVRF
ncbi:MAG: TonB-dependent receptor, partial [Vicinamibacterales bacterium]